MADFVKVDHESLRAAHQKYRRVVIQLEEGRRPHNDILHPAYKLGQFLSEALGVAWTEAETRVPDAPPDDALSEERP